MTKLDSLTSPRPRIPTERPAGSPLAADRDKRRHRMKQVITVEHITFEAVRVALKQRRAGQLSDWEWGFYQDVKEERYEVKS